MIKLKHIINTVVVSEYELQEGEFTIGRNHGNSLQLEDGVVSGDHARLIVEANEYMPDMLDLTLVDMGSTNGTFVNGKRIEQQRVRHDDLIRIGTSEFKIFDDHANTGTQTEYYVPED